MDIPEQAIYLTEGVLISVFCRQAQGLLPVLQRTLKMVQVAKGLTESVENMRQMELAVFFVAQTQGLLIILQSIG